MLILLKIIVIIFIVVFLTGTLVYVLIYFKYKYFLSIKVKTILMQKPTILDENTTERRSVINNEINKNLISKEAFLRKSAYKNTSITIDESFFNDSDMKSEYYLIVIYDNKLNIPLLTARYYFDKSIINKYLKGDSADLKIDNHESEQSALKDLINLKKFKEGRLFLIDRMSGNTNCSLYRHYRNYIYLLFYSELLIHNKNCKFIAMARREKFEKLLTKYLRLGLRIIGSTTHKGKEHWILSGDLKKSYTQIKFSTMFNIILIFKYFISKQRQK